MLLFAASASALGQSRPTHSAPILNNVRFGPLATKMLQRRERSDVPIASFRTAVKQRALAPSPTNHPMELDAGSGRRPPHQSQTSQFG